MTDSNQKPLAPNYTPDVGRLVTDRFDFQSHVDGADFRHHADQIDLFPTLVISSQTVTNVQQALEAIVAHINPPPLPQATIGNTTANLGVITLGGDLSGNGSTAFSPKVSGIQGFPISTVPPSNGQVLTWNGSSWFPQSVGTVTFSGDLSGPTSGPQSVVSLSGASDTVAILADHLTWSASKTSPTISQVANFNGGASLNISAQSCTLGNAGSVIISGGAAANFPGGVSLQDGNGSKSIQLGNLGPSLGRFTSLNCPFTVTSTQLPFNSGDLVTLIGNAPTIPVVGSPAGPIVFGQNGQLWVIQSDNTIFQVGSIPNPSIWGTTGGPYNIGSPPSIGNALEYTYRASLQTTTNSPQIITFTIPNNTSAKIDVIMNAKQVGTSNAAQYNLAWGAVTDSSGFTAQVGSITNADPRITPGASSWFTPSMNIPGSGGALQIITGYNAATTINWSVIVQIVLAQG